jgi:hypothetical protein
LEIKSSLPSAKRSPLLFRAVKLKCPYCGVTPLLRPGSIFELDRGCKPCNYRYEREIGYFSGAAWMITYTVAALSAMAAGGVMVWKYGDQSDLIVAGVPAVFGGTMAVVFIPLGRAIWMWIDHWLHPLTEEDGYEKEPK